MIAHRMSDREWAEGNSREAMIAGGVTAQKKRKKF
jgi:hypothetical protein